MSGTRRGSAARSVAGCPAESLLSTTLVTGATGQVGGALVEELGRGGVRGVTRSKEGAARRSSRAVEGVVAVERAFLVSRDDPRQPEMEAAFVKAAARAGVRRVVKLSACRASPDSPVALMRRHATRAPLAKSQTTSVAFPSATVTVSGLERLWIMFLSGGWPLSRSRVPCPPYPLLRSLLPPR